MRFLNAFSLGQPISLCLQYLQTNEPLITALPPKERMTKIASIARRSQVMQQCHSAHGRASRQRVSPGALQATGRVVAGPWMRWYTNRFDSE